jgi:hypothetical protein
LNPEAATVIAGPLRPRRPTLFAALALAALACASPAQARIHIVFGSRSELMLALGGVQTPDTGPFGRGEWVMAQLGAGYRVGQHVSFGVTGAGHFIGRASVTYLPPGQDFRRTSETLLMTPVTAYAKLRFPVGSRGEPFVGAGAGGYTFWMLPDQHGAPRQVETRLGYHAEAGIAVHTTRFSPRFELRYDTRSTAPAEVGILPRGWFRMVTASLGVQLP